MQFLTSAQVRALAAFQPANVDYVVIDQTLGKPGNLTVTFWMHNGNYTDFRITPEGELKRV